MPPNPPTLDTQDPGSRERPAGSRDSAGPKGRRTPRRESASKDRGRDDIPLRPAQVLLSQAFGLFNGLKRVSQLLDFPGGHLQPKILLPC